jgi:hypothetical protein
MHRTRNAAYGQPYRGFESLPLRHSRARETGIDISAWEDEANGAQALFEELVKLVAGGSRPDANAIAALRSRYDTEQLSALNAT